MGTIYYGYMKFSHKLDKWVAGQNLMPLCVLATGGLLAAGLTSCKGKNQQEIEENALKQSGYTLTPDDYFKAVKVNDKQALKLFMNRGFDIQQVNAKGRNAAHIAAEAGSLTALKFIDSNGVNLDLPDAEGVTPLMIAARKGHVGIVKYLVKNGADALRRDKRLMFPLLYAVNAEQVEVIDVLASKSQDRLDTALLFAADQGHAMAIQPLVRHGASVYAREAGMTPLMFAARRGHAEVMQELLSQGANAYAVSDDGQLVKDYAAGDPEVLEVLQAFDRGGLVKQTNNESAGTPSETTEAVPNIELAWTDKELEKVVQQAMVRHQTSSQEGAEGEVTVDSKILPPKKPVVVKKLSNQKLAVNLSDAKAVKQNVQMETYAEKPLPLRVEVTDTGEVTVRDLRSLASEPIVVQPGEAILDTGLKVKQIKKKIVNTKLTGGKDKELVTVEVEQQATGQQREIYADHVVEATDAVAVVKLTETGEFFAVSNGDAFTDNQGTNYKVMDVRPSQVVMENVATGQVVTLPLVRW